MATTRGLQLNQAELVSPVVLITGATSGLGRAIAEAYAAAGAFVVAADLTPHPLVAPIFTEAMKQPGLDISTPTVDLLNQTQPRAMFVHCDVTDSASVREAVVSTVRRYGRLDIMVNNAGISAVTKSASFQDGGRCRSHEVEDEVFDKDMAVNARGVWVGVKYAAAQYLEQSPRASGDRGWIINICTAMGLVASAATASYCASKGAVLQLTKATALDHANDRIHIICIDPGYIDTAMLEPMEAKAAEVRIRGLHPWGRMALPEDVAGMAVFLTGPGTSFVVDGGYTTQ
ncbi:gluconate 5-dehydrogenase [Exophiala viscosa]|uniref:gluconate 5-dehydrogenase n=1 Tax=Exophiala viscosa TaxID=2486360 RepID=UPI00219D5F26|nr:gluconate 5-dehydrogenase [Exophiala viscosa]